MALYNYHFSCIFEHKSIPLIMLNRYLLFFLILLSSSAFSQEFHLQDQSAKKLTLQFEYKVPSDLKKIQLNEMLYWNPAAHHAIVDQLKGKPQLPYFTQSILLPSTGDYLIHAIVRDSIILTNTQIIPSKGNLKRNVSPDSIPYTFDELYSKNAFYPQSIIQEQKPFIARNERGTIVVVYPIKYNPVKKEIIVYTHIELAIEFLLDQKGTNEITESKGSTSSVSTLNFINKIQKKYVPLDEEKEILLLGTGSYIKISAAWILWKRQAGHTVHVLNTDTITVNPENIKAHIAALYQKYPDLSSVLILGDHEQIPAYSYGIALGEQLWSDSYYGQLAGNDFFPELIVGRFSGTTEQVKTMFARTLEYEKTPSSGTWYLNALGMASDEGSNIGDEGETDWEHLRNIRYDLEAFGYQDVQELYDGSQGEKDAPGNPNSLNTMPALNNGVALFNYTGHGNNNIMYSGSFTSLNVNQAVNQGKYPFVVSVACNNGTFPSGSCLAENFLAAKTNEGPTGAISFAGSSILMSWAPPMHTQDAISDFITEKDPSKISTTIGAIFYNAQQSMLEKYGQTADAEEVMQTWILFGDPSVQFRNRIPVDITAIHPKALTDFEETLQITTNVSDAIAVINIGDSTFYKSLIGSQNTVIDVSTLDRTKDWTLTISKRNHRPYQATIKAKKSVHTDEIRIYPNPSSGLVKIILPEELEAKHLALYAVDGQQVASFTINDLQLELDLSTLAKGVYLVEIVGDDSNSVQRILLN